MSKSHILRANYLWHDSRGSECECEVDVEYTVTPGYEATREEPGADDTVEVDSVLPVDRSYEIGNVDLDAFAEECLADARERWADERDAAAEYRAEQRADDLMRERLA